MALTITETNAVSNKVFDKTLTQTAYDKSPFWVKMKQDGKVRGQFGTSIQWPIRYKQAGGNTAGAVNPDDQVVFRSVDTRTAATLEMAFYRGQAMITWKERAQNMGVAQIVDLLKDKYKEMQQQIYHEFATDLYTYNTSALAIQPLSYVVDSTQTYGGIAAADASTWVSWRDASTTGLNLYGAGSLSYYVNLASFGDEAPSMHLTTKNLYSKFMSLFEGQKIYSDNKLADAGFDNIKFMNAPITADAYCPASYWYGIDFNQLEFRVHSDYDFKTTEWFDLPQAGHPDSMAKVMSWAGNLKVYSRRSSFKYTTLNYTL